jgi:hypothetical protein
VTQLLAVMVAVLLPLWGLLHPPGVLAAIDPAPASFVCEGDPLLAAVHRGAVDAPRIPNAAGGTVPGAFIVLQWRGVSLQLPRTNNAGTPSYCDGRWWWQARDPQHPDFAQRRGDWEAYHCDAST